MSKQNRPSIDPSTEIPGPGQYEALVSDFAKHGRNVSGSVFAPPLNRNPSPRLRAAAVNPGLLKIPIPSIPNKFLTPIIEPVNSDQSTIQVQHEFCKISKLLDDPAKVGPGSYNISGDITQSPKMVMNWQASNSFSSRSGPLLDKDQSFSSVGPGSYNPNKFTDKKPQSMFLPRDGLRAQPSFFNNGSIKDNFEPN